MPLTDLAPPWKAKKTKMNASSMSTSVMTKMTKPISPRMAVLLEGRQQHCAHQQQQANIIVSTMPVTAITIRKGVFAV